MRHAASTACMTSGRECDLWVCVRGGLWYIYVREGRREENEERLTPIKQISYHPLNCENRYITLCWLLNRYGAWIHLFICFLPSVSRSATPTASLSPIHFQKTNLQQPHTTSHAHPPPLPPYPKMPSRYPAHYTPPPCPLIGPSSAA